MEMSVRPHFLVYGGQMESRTPAQRSFNMSRVRNKDTQLERAVRSALHRIGFRFRKNVKTLPGSPDIVLPRYQLAVFVHGCFWHGHEGCRRATLPSTRKEFWTAKIEKNRQRDMKARRDLEDLGYKVEVVWGCEVRDLSSVVDRVKQAARSGQL